MYFISFGILFYFFPISNSLQFWQNVMAYFCSNDFAVWQVHAVLKQSIEVILSILLKQSHCENLESVPAVFAKLSWNFHLSPCCCSALAGNQQYITVNQQIVAKSLATSFCNTELVTQQPGKGSSYCNTASCQLSTTTLWLQLDAFTSKFAQISHFIIYLFLLLLPVLFRFPTAGRQESIDILHKKVYFIPDVM